MDSSGQTPADGQMCTEKGSEEQSQTWQRIRQTWWLQFAPHQLEQSETGQLTSVGVHSVSRQGAVELGQDDSSHPDQGFMLSLWMRNNLINFIILILILIVTGSSSASVKLAPVGFKLSAAKLHGVPPKACCPGVGVQQPDGAGVGEGCRKDREAHPELKPGVNSVPTRDWNLIVCLMFRPTRLLDCPQDVHGVWWT